MQSIAIIQHKGGSSKTTIATNLAVVAANCGLRTALIDTDVQGSATRWARRRNCPMPTVVAVNCECLPAWLRKFGPEYDLCIVDTPGHDWRVLSHAAVSVDLNLIVSRPCQFDLETAIQVADALQKFDVEYASLIAQAASRPSRKLECWRDAYAKLGEVVSTMVSTLTAFQDAVTLGLGVIEYEPDSRAAFEMRQVFDWIHRRLREER